MLVLGRLGTLPKRAYRTTLRFISAQSNISVLRSPCGQQYAPVVHHAVDSMLTHGGILRAADMDAVWRKTPTGSPASRRSSLSTGTSPGHRPRTVRCQDGFSPALTPLL